VGMAWPAYTDPCTRREDRAGPFQGASSAQKREQNEQNIQQRNALGPDKRTGGTRRRTRAEQPARQSRLVRTAAAAWAPAPGAACAVSAAGDAAVFVGGT
jgi:hypothetical protein